MLADLKKIVGHSVIYGLGTMAPKLAGLVLIPLYTSKFSLYEFGMVGLLDSTSQILMGILGLTLSQGFLRFYYDKETGMRQKSYFFTLTFILVIIALVSMIAIYITSDYFSVLLFDKPDYAYLINVMALVSLIQMILIMPSTLLRLQEKAGTFTVTNLVQMTVMMLLTVWFIVWGGQGVEAIYHAQLIASLVYVGMLGRYIWRNVQWRFDRELTARTLQYCWPLVASTVAVTLMTQADRFIIEAYGQLSDVGLYTLGFRISNTLYVLLVASVSFAIQPLIFKKMNDPNNKRFYSKLMTYFVLVVVICVLGMSLFGLEIVKIFARKPEYYEAYRIMPLLSFAVLMSMMKDVGSIGLQISKKTGVLAGIIIAVSAAGIILNLILVKLLQNQGAALAKFLTNALFFFLVYFYAQKAYPIPYENKKLLMMIVVAALLCLPVELINAFPLLIRLALKTGLMILFPVSILLLGFLEPVEAAALKGAWKKWRDLPNLAENIRRIKYRPK